MDTSRSIIVDDINQVYALIGNGRYQLAVVILGCLATFPIGVQEFIIFFLAFNPGWKCADGSKICHFNTTILSTDRHRYGERCQMNRTDWLYAAEDNFSIVTEVNISFVPLFIYFKLCFSVRVSNFYIFERRDYNFAWCLFVMFYC